METQFFPSYPFATLFLSLIFLLPLYFLFHSYKISKSRKHGFKMYPLFGTLPEFLANRYRFLEWTTDVLAAHPTHTAVFKRPGKVHGVITANPDVVEHILKTHFVNYPKGARFRSLLHDFLGGGIFNADDNLWRVQRKTASFEFNTRSLKSFILDCIRSEISTRLIPLLKDASTSGRIVDLQNMLERFAFDNVCKLAFDVDPGCLAGDGSGESEFMRAFEDATTISSGRFMYAVPGFWKVQKILNIGSERRLQETITIVHGFADNIIRTRLEEKSERNKHDDLLSRFISYDESDKSSSPDSTFLRDVIVSFILAGRDTTSSGLSWFFWLLSQNQGALEKIRSEVRAVRTRFSKQPGETYTFDELREMHYLHGALSETLRLYPPVPVDTRSCTDDDILPDGTEIKKNWFITYDTYAMARIESIWGKDCLKFRPERWLDEDGLYKTENPFKFPVFHAGPRICLGKEMAYLQMKSIAACVVELFDVEVIGKEARPEFLLSLTLRMKHGLPVKVKLCRN